MRSGVITQPAITQTATDNWSLQWLRYGDPASVLIPARCRLRPLESNKVRVQMLAAPINPSDLLPIQGAFPHRVHPPGIAGYEGVGVVTEGHATCVRPGARVLPLVCGGTWQRFVDCAPEWLIPVPEDISLSIGVRAFINPLSARLMLEHWSPAGRRVLLSAASSCCAALLAQWAQEDGARDLVGIVRRPSPRLSRLGVRTIDASDIESVHAAAADADLVFDAVGGTLAQAMLDTLAPDALLISYGLLSGNPIAHAMEHRVRLFHLRNELARLGPMNVQARFEEIWPRLRRSVLPPIKIYNACDWRNALAYSHEPGRLAKPVLDLRAHLG